ncbi:sensor histidine kinase [Halalkalibacter alkalisediminis]|nr:sensor histidine kinase [Halalkalibacter alkalisediminis]
MIDIESLNKVCLTEEQRQMLIHLSENLQIIADISQADVFIDCLLSDNQAIVVAEAIPNTTQSLYKNSVLGEIAFEETEPGVMFSLKSGKPIVRSRGITQENVVMQQDIVPINDLAGKTIAVLIKESDISHDLENEKRIKTLLQSTNEEKQELVKTITVQEIHHRVKNNLQVVASLLRLRMRRASSKEVAEVFRDSSSRISSMAMIHDYLAQNGMEETDVKFVMERIATLLISSSSTPEKEILLSVKGESLFLPAEKATSLALVVIELVQNSIKHAFKTENIRNIKIDVKCRKQMVYLTVSDDGCGMDETMTKKKSSLGLQIVEMLVEEQLQGVLSYFYSNRGTMVTITFPFIDREIQ